MLSQSYVPIFSEEYNFMKFLIMQFSGVLSLHHPRVTMFVPARKQNVMARYPLQRLSAMGLDISLV